MTNNAGRTSPLVYARVTGVLLILMTAAATLSTGGLGETLAVPGDATATVQKITESPGAFRGGVIGHLVVLFTDIGVSILLYALLRPVSRTIALLAAAFRLVMAAMRGINLVTHFAALAFLNGAGYMEAFTSEQVAALVQVTMKVFDDGVLLDFLFFAVHLLLVGYLVFKSGFLPKWIGIWLMIGFVGYTLNSFAQLGIFLSGYTEVVSLFVFLPSAMSEFALCLWLLIKGVNVEKWEARAAAAT